MKAEEFPSCSGVVIIIAATRVTRKHSRKYESRECYSGVVLGQVTSCARFWNSMAGHGSPWPSLCYYGGEWRGTKLKNYEL